MIDHLDNLLRHLFIATIDELKDEAQVRFQPPDQDWRMYVSPDQAIYLNIFLADVRENRKLRSNEFTRVVKNGTVSATPAPARIDCHYLITAWSPADVNTQIEPILDEHALLYKVIGVLMSHETLNPKEIYGEDNLPNGFPPSLAEADLPLAVLPVEGFGKLPEFWGTVEWRWKPMVYVIITLPVLTDSIFDVGPQVTTVRTKAQLRGEPSTMEESIRIAGIVSDANDPATRLEGAQAWLAGTPHRVLTNALGQYSFSALDPGAYTLQVSKAGFATHTRSIKVPRENEQDETYDVELTKSP